MKKTTITLAATLLLAALTFNPIHAQTTQQSENRAAWFEEARFGMFIHFGLYSIPGGVYKGEVTKRGWYAEWIRWQYKWPEVGGIPKEEYHQFLDQFNPTEFDADEWILEAKRAGMKYFLITAKHHDGFALWPSKVSKYNVVDATPFGRDILGELKAACDKHGLRLGFYYSHWQDWEHPGGAMPPWDGTRKDPKMEQPPIEDFNRYWKEIALPQVRELIEGYDPDFFWFDTWVTVNKEQITEEKLDELIGLVRELSPKCLINSRIGSTWVHSKGDDVVDFISMGDNQFPKKKIDKPWESSGTMNRSWGYNKVDYQWKSPARLLQNLVDAASAGGNYQLNIGPMGNGKFPAAAVRRLREMGGWVAANEEAIFGTEPVALPKPKWGRFTGRSTDKGYRLYIHIYEWPEDELLRVNGISKAPTGATLLEVNQPLEVTADGKGLTVHLRPTAPDERISVIALDFKKKPFKANQEK